MNRAQKMMIHEKTHMGASLCHFCAKTFANHASARNHEIRCHPNLKRSVETHAEANRRLVSLKPKIDALEQLLKVRLEPTACIVPTTQPPSVVDANVGAMDETNSVRVEPAGSALIPANVVAADRVDQPGGFNAMNEVRPDLGQAPEGPIDPAVSIAQCFNARIYDFNTRRLLFDVGLIGECTAKYEPLMSRDFEAFIDKVEKHDAHLGGLMKVSDFSFQVYDV